MSEDDILAWAVREQRLVVTMDKDFGEMVYRSGRAHAGVLLLRLDDATGDEKVRVLRAHPRTTRPGWIRTSQLTGQADVENAGYVRPQQHATSVVPMVGACGQ